MAGLHWQETLFVEGGWKASMRGLMPWKGTAKLRYGTTDLDAKTSTCIAISPDKHHIWTVCLDHTLRAWNIETGQMTFQMDLGADATRDFDKPLDQLVDPGHSDLLRLLPQQNTDKYTIVTFSPLLRQFQFWIVRDPTDMSLGVEPALPGFKFSPPIEDLVNSPAWTLSTFSVQKPSSRAKDYRFWLLVHSGSKSHCFSVYFNLAERTKDLAAAWTNNWSEVSLGSIARDQVKSSLLENNHFDSLHIIPAESSAVERWTKLIFHPGRFTFATLETALCVYQRRVEPNSPHTPSLSTTSQSLQERICECVGRSVQLGKLPSGEVAYAAYDRNVAGQWEGFFRIAQDLERQRETTLSLAYDPHEKIPWLVMADQIAPVRKLAKVEALYRNSTALARPTKFKPDDDSKLIASSNSDRELGQFLHALEVFRKSFSRLFLKSFKSLLETDSLQESSLPTSDRIQLLYEQSRYDGQVTDEDYNSLTAALDIIGGFDQLSDDNFLATLMILGEKTHGRSQNMSLTTYGERFLSQGTQDTFELGLNILVDLALLVLFMAVELEEDDLPAAFDSSRIYEGITSKTKEYLLLDWLGYTALERIPNGVRGCDQGNTLLVKVMKTDWETMNTPQKLPVDELLTYWCRAGTLGVNILQQYEKLTTHVMTNLLMTGELQHAVEFLRFLPSTAWSTYVRARLYLANSELTDAALWFEEAAAELGESLFLDMSEPFRLILLN